MTTTNSPMYAAGRIDGEADARRIGECPTRPARGPQPPNPDYPVMYERGYHEVFDATVAHICTGECRK